MAGAFLDRVSHSGMLWFEGVSAALGMRWDSMNRAIGDSFLVNIPVRSGTDDVYRGLACFMIKQFMYIILQLTKNGVPNVLQLDLCEPAVKVAIACIVAIERSRRASVLAEKCGNGGAAGMKADGFFHPR
jgi:hypothetical protein